MENPAQPQKIVPCLWFDKEAEEAAKFYASLFKDSKIRKITRYGKAGFEIHGQPEGKVMTVEFELEGQEFGAMDSAYEHGFSFNEAISLTVRCGTQKEIDYFWEKLSAEPKAEQCGWVKDKYGLSWQVVPAILGEMLRDKDVQKSESVMNALLQMKKIDVEGLKKAYGQV